LTGVSPAVAPLIVPPLTAELLTWGAFGSELLATVLF
jgi:hypothetical protein